MNIPLEHLLLLAGILFLLGAFCILTRRNLIMILLGVEIMLNATAVAFVGAASRWGQIEGQAVSLFILAVAAAEVSVGLAIIIDVFRKKGTVDVQAMSLLRG